MESSVHSQNADHRSGGVRRSSAGRPALRRCLGVAVTGAAVGIASMPLLGGHTRASAAVGSVAITSATVPSSEFSDTSGTAAAPFDAVFTATNHGSTTATNVTLTDRVVDRPAFLPEATFVGARANGSQILSVSANGGATCNQLPNDPTALAGWATTPLLATLLGLVDPVLAPVLSNFLPVPSPGDIPGAAETTAGQELAFATSSPSPGNPEPQGNPPLAPIETASCTVASLAPSASFTMTVHLRASVTSVDETAPIADNAVPPIVPTPSPVPRLDHVGVCGASTVQPARVCTSAPIAVIENEGDVSASGPGGVAVPSDVTHLETQVVPAVTIQFSGSPSAQDGSPSFEYFQLALNRGSDSPISVSVSTSGTASAGTDFTAPASTFTINPGDRLPVLTVALIDSGPGASFTVNRTFDLNLTSPTTASTLNPTVKLVDSSGHIVSTLADTATITPDAGD